METKNFALGKKNLKLIVIAFALVLIGFALMLGGSTNFEAFDPDIFSFRRIVLGPGCSFIGFVLMIFAILKKDIDQNPDNLEQKK